MFTAAAGWSKLNCATILLCTYTENWTGRLQPLRVVQIGFLDNPQDNGIQVERPQLIADVF